MSLFFHPYYKNHPFGKRESRKLYGSTTFSTKMGIKPQIIRLCLEPIRRTWYESVFHPHYTNKRLKNGNYEFWMGHPLFPQKLWVETAKIPSFAWNHKGKRRMGQKCQLFVFINTTLYPQAVSYVKLSATLSNTVQKIIKFYQKPPIKTVKAVETSRTPHFKTDKTVKTEKTVKTTQIHIIQPVKTVKKLRRPPSLYCQNCKNCPNTQITTSKTVKTVQTPKTKPPKQSKLS